MPNLYVAKVTAAGQVSLPKPLREELGIGEDYLVLEPLGDAILVRKVPSVREELLAYFEKEARAKGITKERINEALKKAGPKLLKELYGVEP